MLKLNETIKNITTPVILSEKPTKRQITSKFIDKHFKKQIEVLLENNKKTKEKTIEVHEVQMGQQMPLETYLTFLCNTLRGDFTPQATIRMERGEDQFRWVIVEETDEIEYTERVLIDLFKTIIKELIDEYNAK